MWRSKYNSKWLVVAVLSLTAFAVQASSVLAEQFTGKVVAIIDGDTIEVMREGRAERVRLNGIDCPESHQAFGTRAKQFTAAAVFGKQVTVRTHDRDRYGRAIGDVTLLDGSSLNQALVQAGLAWWYREYSTDRVLERLDEEARNAKRGLWADPHPIPPWEFRKSTQSNTGARRSERRGVPPQGQILPVQYQLDQNQQATVFVTATGQKYHSANCRYLSKSKIPISLKDAKARGYGPCSVCRPPA